MGSPLPSACLECYFPVLSLPIAYSVAREWWVQHFKNMFLIWDATKSHVTNGKYFIIFYVGYTLPFSLNTILPFTVYILPFSLHDILRCSMSILPFFYMLFHHLFSQYILLFSLHVILQLCIYNSKLSLHLVYHFLFIIYNFLCILFSRFLRIKADPWAITGLLGTAAGEYQQWTGQYCVGRSTKEKTFCWDINKAEHIMLVHSILCLEVDVFPYGA